MGFSTCVVVIPIRMPMKPGELTTELAGFLCELCVLCG